MASNLLYLVPKDFHALPSNPQALVETLRREEFIGEAIDYEGDKHYRPGEEFLSLITFLGCSPVISMGEPGKTGDEFCHIAFIGPHETPAFIAGDNVKTPRCPSCGHRFEAWQPLIGDWLASPDTAVIACPQCGKELTAPQLRWRKCAGFGRYFIEVWGIFESEAVPSPNLLALLERASGTAWQYFYVRRR